MTCPHRLGENGDGAPCGADGRLCDACAAAEAREWLAFAGAVAIALALGIFFGAMLALWWI